MELQIRKGRLAEMKADALAIPVFEDEWRDKKNLSGPARETDEACGGLIREILMKGDFAGKASQQSLIYTGGKIAAPRLILVGLGERKKCDLESVRISFARGCRKLGEAGGKNVAVAAGPSLEASGPLDFLEAALEAIILGQYRYLKYKTGEAESKALGGIVIAYDGVTALDDLKKTVRRVEAVCGAVCLARDLGNAPANDLTPARLAEEAIRLSKPRSVRCTVLDEARIRKAGMSALLGVAQGSHQPPRFIILEYRGARRPGGNVVLVGKGITFDTGGISIKPADKMGEMKADMAGAAAVLATVCAAAELKLPVNLVGLIPATENMPGGGAYRPGDVLKTLGGKTVEVISTDAEGRLILADALSYAGRFKPAVVIDIATLTGACTVALGEDIGGLFSRDERIRNGLLRASEKTCERIWELPLAESYQELIRSDIADLKNTGGRMGGAITAALFLGHFAGDLPWAHLDIAGPGFSSKDAPYRPKGATGFGVRLLIEYLSRAST